MIIYFFTNISVVVLRRVGLTILDRTQYIKYSRLKKITLKTSGLNDENDQRV